MSNIATEQLVTTYKISDVEVLELYSKCDTYYLYSVLEGRPENSLASVFSGHTDSSIKKYLKKHHGLV